MTNTDRRSFRMYKLEKKRRRNCSKNLESTKDSTFTSAILLSRPLFFQQPSPL